MIKALIKTNSSSWWPRTGNGLPVFVRKNTIGVVAEENLEDPECYVVLFNGTLVLLSKVFFDSTQYYRNNWFTIL